MKTGYRKIELDAPNLGKREKNYLTKAIETNFISTFGPFIQEFEEKFAAYVNAKKAVSTQSGTSAIHIALHELGIKNGDEVIVPALTFVATVNPVMYVGAMPVFVDVDPATWNMNPEDVEGKITEKTKAIIPVHLYGSPCNMDAIVRIARKHNIYIIEDATESLGATYRGMYTGTIGDFGVFSFNGNKAITTGGGGMVVGNDEKRMEHIRFLVNQARDETKGYYHSEIGFNYRMTNIEAALGLAQLEKLNAFLAKKDLFRRIYTEELSCVDCITFQKKYDFAKSSYWMNCIIINENLDIETFRKKLKEKGIPTRRIFMPIIEFPPYQSFKNGNYENSYRIYEKGLCLPSSTLNSEDDVRYISQKIKEVLQ